MVGCSCVCGYTLRTGTCTSTCTSKLFIATAPRCEYIMLITAFMQPKVFSNFFLICEVRGGEGVGGGGGVHLGKSSICEASN